MVLLSLATVDSINQAHSQLEVEQCPRCHCPRLIPPLVLNIWRLLRLRRRQTEQVQVSCNATRLLQEHVADLVTAVFAKHQKQCQRRLHACQTVRALVGLPQPARFAVEARDEAVAEGLVAVLDERGMELQLGQPICAVDCESPMRVANQVMEAEAETYARARQEGVDEELRTEVVAAAREVVEEDVPVEIVIVAVLPLVPQRHQHRHELAILGHGGPVPDGFQPGVGGAVTDGLQQSFYRRGRRHRVSHI